MTNKESTRYYSDRHEKSVCKALGGLQQSNSGAGLFKKGDVVVKDASLLVECKTCMTDKDSFSIKKEWISKNKKEAFEVGLDHSCVAFNFGPDSINYYVIDENLMRQLVNHLEEN